MSVGFPSGIASVGAYAPSLRITAEELGEAWGHSKASGVPEKAVPDVDEDAVTMAYEAATRAITAGDVDPESVDHLALATTNPPVEEEDLTARLGSMLGLPESAGRTTLTASTAAGVTALVDAARRDGRSLVVASDCPEGVPDDEYEHAAGAGAAAFVVDPDGMLALEDAAEFSTPYPGTRFRRRGSETVEGLGVTGYERSAFAEALSGAAEDLDYDPDAIDAAAVQAPDGALPYRVGESLGLDDGRIAAAAVVQDLGDLGAASVPVGIAAGLENDAETLVAAGYGSGATGVLGVLSATDRVPGAVDLGGDRYLEFDEYVRRRGGITSGTPAGGGAYVSVPTWRRSLAQRYRLQAGRCSSCGALNFPPTGACSNCRELVDFEPVTLERTGTVEAVSVVAGGGAPPEFAEMQAQAGGDYATGIVAFDGPDGDSASAPVFLVEDDPDDFTVGDHVEATIRRIYTQEGVTRYGVKVRPLEE